MGADVKMNMAYPMPSSRDNAMAWFAYLAARETSCAPMAWEIVISEPVLVRNESALHNHVKKAAAPTAATASLLR